MQEEWRPVRGFEGLYNVSSLGRIVSLVRHGQYQDHRIRIPFINKGGYHVVTLWKEGRCYSRQIHRLVAAAFIGPCPRKRNVNHIDGNKANNSSSNLEYTTPKENSQHAVATGLMRKGEQVPHARLTEQKVKEIRLLNGHMSLGQIGALYGVGRTTVFSVLRRRSWKHVA